MLLKALKKMVDGETVTDVGALFTVNDVIGRELIGRGLAAHHAAPGLSALSDETDPLLSDDELDVMETQAAAVPRNKMAPMARNKGQPARR